MARTIKIPSGKFCEDCACLRFVDMIAGTEEKKCITVPHCVYYYTFLAAKDGSVYKDIHCPEEGLEVTIYGDNEY